MKFSEIFIESIHRLLYNNWYSILINGTRYGFFKSSRGVKQGDPLFPDLFSLVAKALSKVLNKLNENHQFIGFLMSSKGPRINHLSYVDDLFLFSFGDMTSIKLLMEVPEDYQDASVQQINKDKSCFLFHSFRDKRTNRRIRKWIGFRQV